MHIKFNLEDFGLTYGNKTIKINAAGRGFSNSPFRTVDYNSAPRVVPAIGSISVYNLIDAVTSVEVYVDGTLQLTQPRAAGATNPFIIDLSGLSIEEGTQHTLYVKALGEGVPTNQSTTVMYGATPIYGVRWVNDNSTEMERTDDAVGMSFAIQSSTGAIASDFNSVFPWDEARNVQDGSNEMKSLPGMWFRVGTDDNGDINSVAVTKIPSGDGNWYYVDPFLYGRYGASASGSGLASVSGVSRLANTTIEGFRTKARATGEGYFQLDLYHYWVMTFLWWIEWATKNSASIMEGKTSATGSSIVQTGGTDSVSTPSGFNPTTKQMRFHEIEDFIGNQMEFVDGIWGNTGNKIWVCKDPSKFKNGTTDYEQVSYTSNANGNCITAIGWDHDHPFMAYPTKTVGSGYTNGFCDGGYLVSSSSPVLYCGSRYSSSDANFGRCSFNFSGASSSSGFIGGRLLKTP